MTSPATPRHNCIAWSAGDVERWWRPGVCWPVEAPADPFGIGVLERAFAALGHERTTDAGLESGFEKVALHGDSFFYTHATRQLPDGS